jgi:hypothetical protein
MNDLLQQIGALSGMELGFMLAILLFVDVQLILYAHAQWKKLEEDHSED